MIRIRMDRDARIPTLHLMQGEQGVAIVQLQVPRYDGNFDLSLLDFMIRIEDGEGTQHNIKPYVSPELHDEYILIDWMVTGVVTRYAGKGSFRVIGSGGAGDDWIHTYESVSGLLDITESVGYIPSGDTSVDEFAEYIAEYKADVDAAALVSATAAEAATAAKRAAEAANLAAERLTTGEAIPGKAATVEIGNVSAGDVPGVTNVGTDNAAVLDIVLPKGDKGENGLPAKIRMLSTVTVESTEEANVTMSRNEDTNTYSLKFYIPRGEQGLPGEDGEDGHDGHDGHDGKDASIEGQTISEAFGGVGAYSNADLTALGIQATRMAVDFADNGTYTWRYPIAYAAVPIVQCTIQAPLESASAVEGTTLFITEVSTTGVTVRFESSHRSFSGWINFTAVGYYNREEATT